MTRKGDRWARGFHKKCPPGCLFGELKHTEAGASARDGRPAFLVEIRNPYELVGGRQPPDVLYILVLVLID